MANDVVRLSQEFLFAKAGNVNEGLVRVGNQTLQVGFADDNIALIKRLLTSGGLNGVLLHARLTVTIGRMLGNLKTGKLMSTPGARIGRRGTKSSMSVIDVGRLCRPVAAFAGQA
jgi:hypothetical protein